MSPTSGTKVRVENIVLGRRTESLSESGRMLSPDDEQEEMEEKEATPLAAKKNVL